VKKHLISIIVPVLDEEDNIIPSYEAIVKELESLQDIEFEIIFTDNHSSDRTFEYLEILSAKDSRVKVLRFARNFGFNRSILEGYRQARGDVAIQFDCDLEDPPSLFLDFIDLWKQGHDVVVGIRANRQESFLMITLRRAFYVFLNKISSSYHQVDAGDFRLVDRKILDQLSKIDDAEPYVRGLISELSCNQGSIPYSRSLRVHGKSKFPLRQLFKFGLDAVYAHSVLPLR
jgi:glycosyltransferase involved in cell wall biosynthesis